MMSSGPSEKSLDDTRSPLKVYLSKVQSVDRVSDTQVRFNLIEPFAIFDRQMTFVSILPKKAFETMGEAEFGQKPIGSGPYRLVRRVRDDRTELSAFAEYWRGEPKIKTVVLRPIPSPFARNSALLTGEIDIDPSVPPSLARNWPQSPR